MLELSLEDFLKQHPGRTDITRAVKQEAPELYHAAELQISHQLQKLVRRDTVPSMSAPSVPINSVQGIESLILFGLQVFTQVFSLFVHPTTPVPVAAASALIQQIQATPGMTPDHAQVAQAAVNAAVEAQKLTQAQTA